MCVHLYKRLWSNKEKLVPSPMNSFLLPGEKSRRAEDGHRFESFLILAKGDKLFLRAADFLCEKDNWELSLSEFHEQFTNLQEEGEKLGEPSVSFSSRSGSSSWFICFKDPIIQLYEDSLQRK
jgi:hypothetical protein